MDAIVFACGHPLDVERQGRKANTCSLVRWYMTLAASVHPS